MYRLRGPLALALTLFVGVIMLVWVCLPYYYLILVAFLPGGATIHGFYPSTHMTLANFVSVLMGFNQIWPYFLNTIVVAGGSTLIAMLLAIPAGYGLSRLRQLPSAQYAYLSMFILRMLPPICFVIPFFIAFTRLHLMDTRLGLIIATTPLLLPFAIWTIKVFFDATPESMEEAARIDGCTTFGSFRRVVLPVVGQGISATTVLVFLQAYVEYMFASALSKNVAVTLPVYLVSFQSEYYVYVGSMMAATIIGTIPMIFLYFYAQKYMQRMSLAGVH